ncbi:hypothetical protein Barb7_02654 [Bacteroidales bacterium Barb7]|nr:hypothetical protein Barb7_02654 [Bacteroidales bacterium Barb7]
MGKRIIFPHCPPKTICGTVVILFIKITNAKQIQVAAQGCLCRRNIPAQAVGSPLLIARLIVGIAEHTIHLAAVLP